MGVKRRLRWSEPSKEGLSHGSTSKEDHRDGLPTQLKVKVRRRMEPRSHPCWTAESSRPQNLPARECCKVQKTRGVLGRRIHAAWLSIIGPRPTQPRLKRKGRGQKERKKEREERRKLTANIGSYTLAIIMVKWLPHITQQSKREQPMDMG